MKKKKKVSNQKIWKNLMEVLATQFYEDLAKKEAKNIKQIEKLLRKGLK